MSQKLFKDTQQATKLHFLKHVCMMIDLNNYAERAVYKK